MTQKLSDTIFHIYFSPYTGHALKIGGVRYATLEHAYQCARYDDERIREEILGAPSAVEAWKVSSKYKNLQIPDFREHKFEVMKDLARIKIEQHEDVRQALLDSGDDEIIKNIVTGPPGDGVWDGGLDGTGENKMGKMWMELRGELNK